MKRRMMKLTALLLALSLTAGCGKAVETVAEKNEVSTESVAENEDEKSEDDVAEEESIGTAFNVEALKMKYAGNESVEYTEPIYNLERDHAFVFENIPDEVYTYNEYDFFDVYYDSSLDEHMRVQLDIEKDYDNHTLTVSPAFAFTYDVNLGCVEEDTWGSRSKFYLVQNVDLQTGEALEKPLVTMFTIRNISSPGRTMKGQKLRVPINGELIKCWMWRPSILL